MKARVADELARDDLTSQISTCISDAIAFYQDERFAFNESRDLTFPTVAAQEFYTSSDLAAIGTIYAFDYLVLVVGSTQVWTIRREQPEVLEVLSQAATQRGQPSSYAFYNKKIRLYPTPDAVYTVRIAGHVKYAAPATDGETNNFWMTDGEKLIRSRAKYELSINYTKDMEEAQRAAAQTTEAFEKLKGISHKLTGRGVISAMQF